MSHTEIPFRVIRSRGAGQPLGQFSRRWMRFWMRRSGVGFIGRIASRLAAWVAPPGLEQVSLAYMNARGYIDANATINHADLRLGRNVYVASGVSIIGAVEGGLIALADKVAIHPNVTLEVGKKGFIQVGAKSSIHPGSQLKAYVEPILIGSGVMIAANTALYSYDHGMDPDLPIRQQPIISKGPITIEDEAWLGTAVIVLSGVTIGEGAVVAAGSVVTKDVPAGSIVAGNPARVLKYRSELTSIN